MGREGEKGDGAQNSTTFAAFWNRWKQFRLLLRQRNGDSRIRWTAAATATETETAAVATVTTTMTETTANVRTFVRSLAAESRAKERGGRNDSIKCESARRDGDGDGEATLKRTAAKVI